MQKVFYTKDICAGELSDIWGILLCLKLSIFAECRNFTVCALGRRLWPWQSVFVTLDCVRSVLK